MKRWVLGTSVIAAIAASGCTPGVDARYAMPRPTTDVIDQVAALGLAENPKSQAYIDEVVKPTLELYYACIEVGAARWWQVDQPPETLAPVIEAECSAERAAVGNELRKAMSFMPGGSNTALRQADLDANDAKLQQNGQLVALTHVVQHRAGPIGGQN